MAIDLTALISEREQPEEAVPVYLAEKLLYAKAVLKEQLAKVADADKVAEVEAKIAEIDNDLEATKYVFTLQGTPRRLREDIESKALAKFPYKPDFLGRETDLVQTRNREEAKRALSWSAHIKSITDPAGESDTDFTPEQIAKIALNIPDGAVAKIDATIKALAEKVDAETIAAQDPTF